MKSLNIIITTALFLAISAGAETQIPAGEVSGLWKKADSPYIVTGNITVAEGATLKIDPEVTVRFAANSSLTVHGVLQAGEREEKHVTKAKDDKRTIVFTTDLNGDTQGWGGLRFIEAGKDCYLQDCIIKNARVTGDGGGIYCEDCKLDIANSEIRGNEAGGKGGGLAAVKQAHINVANVTILDNQAGIGGGGVYASHSEVNLANVDVTQNRNGGIIAENASVNLANCTVSDNTGAKLGGGIYASASSINLANASVSGNSNGGVACLDHCGLSVANSSIRRNRDADHGGGIYLMSSTLSMANANVNDNAQGGIYARDSGTLSLVNCSIRENKGDALDHDDNTKLQVINCSIDGTVIDGTIHGDGAY